MEDRCNKSKKIMNKTTFTNMKSDAAAVAALYQPTEKTTYSENDGSHAINVVRVHATLRDS